MYEVVTKKADEYVKALKDLGLSDDVLRTERQAFLELMSDEQVRDRIGFEYFDKMLAIYRRHLLPVTQS